MLPILELRITIPYGILKSNIDWLVVFVICVLGNFLICIPILYFLEYFDRLAKRFQFFNKVLNRVYKRTRSKANIINKYNYIGIILFVGTPLPLTGAWTGCLASHLLGLDKKKTLGSIFIGLTMSALIVTAISLVAENLLPWIGITTL